MRQPTIGISWMNQALRPQPQLGEVLPGGLFLGLILALLYDHNPEVFAFAWDKDTSSALLLILAGGFLFVSWIIGTLIDSMRNLIMEYVLDRRFAESIDWQFLVTGDKDKVTQFDEYYFAYYQAKANYAIALFLFLIYAIASLILYQADKTFLWSFFLSLTLFFLCSFDSLSLRKEMGAVIRKVSNTSTEQQLGLPHTGVYTRIKQSVHGVGVFAICDIPAGTNIFAGDANEMVDQDRTVLHGLDPDIKELYLDFCVWKDGKIKCPTNFNNLTPAWYLNHSKTPNVICDADYNFIAARHIEKNEELTSDYSTYDERPIDFS